MHLQRSLILVAITRKTSFFLPESIVFAKTIKRMLEKTSRKGKYNSISEMYAFNVRTKKKLGVGYATEIPLL